MNKFQLVLKMSELTKLPQSTCKKALEAFMHIVIENLQNHEETTLTRFGTFAAIKREKRIGVNPATGKKMNIPEAYVTKFKSSKNIKKLSMPK